MFGFVSKSPGDGSGNLNFKIAGARANPDFPVRTRDVLSAEGAPRTRRGATPPHAIRGRPRTRGARAEPRLSRGRDSAGGWKPARERVPAGAPRPPPGLAARDPPGSWAAATGTMPGTPGLNCARIPGRCSRRRDPRSGPGGPPPPPLASSCSPYSPPLAPPVGPGGLSPQRGRRAAGLAGAELLPGLPDPPRLRALPVPAPRALDTPDPPDFGPLCPSHPSSRPFLAFLLLPHPQTRGPPTWSPRSRIEGSPAPCPGEGGLYIPVSQVCTFRRIQTARDTPCAFGQVSFSGPQCPVCKMGTTVPSS